MKKYILLTIFSITIFCVKAQPYNTAVGARAGLYNSISLKYFANESLALEAIAGIRSFNSVVLTGLGELHYGNIADQPELAFYVGGGGHVGQYFTNNWYNNEKGYYGPNSYFILGIDLIAGFEYDLSNLIEFPLTASLDFKPHYDILGRWRSYGDMAITVRYKLN